MTGILAYLPCIDFVIEYIIVDITNQSKVLQSINPYKLILNSIGKALKVTPSNELIRKSKIDCNTLNLINGLSGIGLLALTNK